MYALAPNRLCYPMSDYTREYFNRHASDWVAGYADRTDEFPLEAERVRVCLEAVTAGMRPGDMLVDLGCGGGELVLEAAARGYEAVGVDIAPGMIEEAERRRADAGEDIAVRARFVTAALGADSGIAPGSASAVTALGLIEYLPDDAALFSEIGRLLSSDGLAAISCRNELFSLSSMNGYTAHAIETGRAELLLDEMREALAEVDTSDFVAAGLALGSATATEDVPTERRFDHGALYTAERKMHTPAGVAAAAAGFDLAYERTVCVHPHPFPPVLERLAPRMYNEIARALQAAVEESPLGLTLCSTFVAVLRRR